jgi:hypothetical protein
MKIFMNKYKERTLHLTDLQHSALFYKWVPYIPHKLIFLVILLSQLKTVHIIEMVVFSIMGTTLAQAGTRVEFGDKKLANSSVRQDGSIFFSPKIAAKTYSNAA